MVDLLSHALRHNFSGSCLSAHWGGEPRTMDPSLSQAAGPSQPHGRRLYLCSQASYVRILLFRRQRRGQASVSYWKDNSSPIFY